MLWRDDLQLLRSGSHGRMQPSWSCHWTAQVGGDVEHLHTPSDSLWHVTVQPRSWRDSPRLPRSHQRPHRTSITLFIAILTHSDTMSRQIFLVVNLLCFRSRIILQCRHFMRLTRMKILTWHGVNISLLSSVVWSFLSSQVSQNNRFFFLTTGYFTTNVIWITKPELNNNKTKILKRSKESENNRQWTQTTIIHIFIKVKHYVLAKKSKSKSNLCVYSWLIRCLRRRWSKGQKDNEASESERDLRDGPTKTCCKILTCSWSSLDRKNQNKVSRDWSWSWTTLDLWLLHRKIQRQQQ